MAEELDYSGNVTVSVALRMARGDTKARTFAHEWSDATINEARFQAKNSAGTRVISLSKESNASQWDFSTDGELTLTLLPADTEQLAVGTYTFAIELRDADSPAVVYTPVIGSLELYDDVVNDFDGSGELSWASREEILQRISTVAVCHDFTTLAADASSGASTVEVESAIFTNGDTVRVVLDDDTYDETTVTVSGTTLTLGANLTGDASKFNAVRKV